MSRTYEIYRDDEILEVGWLKWKLYRLPSFWQACKDTDWLHYFYANGPAEAISKEFTGFRKLQNFRSVYGQWIINVRGGIRKPLGNNYYQSVESHDVDECAEGNWSERTKAKVAWAEQHINLYTEPDCTCRIGFHRRCPHHYRTKN